MKTILLLLTFIFSCHIMIAQQLTKNQALAFAEKLYQIEILSEKGRDVLTNKINKDSLAKLGSFPSYYNQKVETELSVSSILNFCGRAFANEYIFRTGLTAETQDFIRNTMLPEAQQKGLTQEEVEWALDSIGEAYDEVEFEKLAEKVKQFITTQEGYKIENKIPIEDEIPDNNYKINSELFLKSINRNGFSAITFIGNSMFSEPELGIGLVHPTRSVIGKMRTRTLQDLLTIGLIDNKIYEDVMMQNQAKHLPAESLLLMYAAERAFYYENFSTRKAEELKILQNLKEADVLSEVNYKAVLNSYQTFEIKAPFEYLPYCNNSVLIDLKNHNDPVEGYHHIFTQIKTILPNVNFYNLDIQAFIDDSNKENAVRSNLQIKFIENGKTYISKFYYDHIDSIEAQTAGGFKIDLEAFKGVNRLLVDQGSDYRLYCAVKYASRYNNFAESGALILMTENQYNAWNFTDRYDRLFEKQNHDNTFNHNFIKVSIAAFEKIGLLAHLTPEEIELGKEKIIQTKIEHYADILACFPQIIVDFDPVYGNEKEPFKSLTETIIKISKGAFNVENITDDFEENFKNETPLSNFSFELNGKIYQAELYLHDEAYKNKFMQLINRALEENGMSGRLYTLAGNFNLGGYLFLSSSQYADLKNKYRALFEE